MNEVNVKIRLTRIKDELCLMWTADGREFRVVIASAVLFVRKVKVNPRLPRTRKDARERDVCKFFTVPRSYLYASQEKLFSGQLPFCVMVGCVEKDAFNRRCAKNPVNFQNMFLAKLSLYQNGQQQTKKTCKSRLP